MVVPAMIVGPLMVDVYQVIMFALQDRDVGELGQIAQRLFSLVQTCGLMMLWL